MSALDKDMTVTDKAVWNLDELDKLVTTLNKIHTIWL